MIFTKRDIKTNLILFHNLLHMYRCNANPSFKQQNSNSQDVLSTFDKLVIGIPPLTFVFLELVFSYLVYIGGLCIVQLIIRCSDGFYGCNNSRSSIQLFFHLVHGLSYIILYHVLLFLFLTSYIKTILFKAGNIPKSFFEENVPSEPPTEIENRTKTAKNSITFCSKCEQYRPARAHHCK